MYHDHKPEPELSSFITNITVILASQQVIVTIGSKVYQYSNVPAQVMAMFLVAESKGGFLNRYIKGTYPCTQIN